MTWFGANGCAIIETFLAVRLNGDSSSASRLNDGYNARHDALESLIRKYLSSDLGMLYEVYGAHAESFKYDRGRVGLSLHLVEDTVVRDTCGVRLHRIPFCYPV